MAAKGKKPSPAVDIPECPVCLETMTAPIFLCASGHSLCNSCTLALCPPTCPICRQPMTQMRNRSLEEIIGKAKLPCPNRAAGCVYSLPAEAMPAHEEECIFRARECPHAVFGNCSWTGELKKLVDHFKEKHPANSLTGQESELVLIDLTLKECVRRVFLISQPQQNFLFILTLKIDTIQRMAYWAIQHIGQKKVARQHLYEIQVTSKRDPQRKVVFTEHCFNDAMKADEIFRQSNCAVMPLDMLTHFIKDRMLSIRFTIKRLSVGPNKDNNEDRNENKTRVLRNEPRSRDSSLGPEHRGQKGPGPKPHWKKHPGQNPGQKPGPKNFNKAHQ